MVEKDYLSIADFAKKAGITRQTVYNNLTKELSNFVKEFDNKKYIHCKALELYGVKQFDKNSSTTFTDFVKYFDKQNETLSRLVDVLEADIEIKNKQIEASNERQRELSIMLNQQQKLNAHALLTGQSAEQEEKIKDFYKQKYYQDIKEIARILELKFPGAVDFIIEQAEKSGE